MNKSSRKIKVIFLIIINLILGIALQFFAVSFRRAVSDFRTQQRLEQSLADGRLKHQEANIKKPLMNFSDDEIDQIINAFQLTIPESEANIEFRLFAKTKNNESGKYYLELDNVKDREALYNANLEAREKGVYMGTYNLRTDDNGEYPYYFVFFVKYESDYGTPDKDLIKSVSNVYEDLKITRD